jgi:hypothetical protein
VSPELLVERLAALGTVRDDRLHRAPHDSYEAYSRERWGFTARQADRIIARRRASLGRLAQRAARSKPPLCRLVSRPAIPTAWSAELTRLPR